MVLGGMLCLFGVQILAVGLIGESADSNAF